MHGGGAEQGVRSWPAKRLLRRSELIEWVLSAQPGARLCYGHGEHASKIATEEFNAELLKLAGQGYIYLFHGKADPLRRTHDYIAERSSRQVRA